MSPITNKQDLIVDTLRQVAIFKQANDEVLDFLSTHARRWHCSANVSLFSRDDDADRFYAIVTGSIRLQRTTRSGKTVQIAQFGPLDHFGDLSLVDSETRLGDALTTSDCELITIDRETFLQCIMTQPELVIELARHFARRLRKAADDLEARHELDVTGRLAESLLNLAETAGSASPDGEIALSERLTHAQMADQVGTARECISRAIDDLRHIGAIQAAGRPTRITVIDIEKLRARCLLH